MLVYSSLKIKDTHVDAQMETYKTWIEGSKNVSIGVKSLMCIDKDTSFAPALMHIKV